MGWSQHERQGASAAARKFCAARVSRARGFVVVLPSLLFLLHDVSYLALLCFEIATELVSVKRTKVLAAAAVEVTLLVVDEVLWEVFGADAVFAREKVSLGEVTTVSVRPEAVKNCRLAGI